jgi:predicted amino acid-binding ACT domain protein
MGVGILGIDRTGIITCVTKKLRDHGLNIDSGFGSLIETATGAFFEISGEPKTMQRMFDEILRDRHEQSSVPDGVPPTYGKTYELKIIGPDRPGIVYDISKRLIDESINIDQMVIRTQRRRGMAIVYGRLGISSDESRVRFLDSLGSVEGFEQWKIKCERQDLEQRQYESFNDMMATMN